MEKEFVPYELVIRMKSIGFNEPCFASYITYRSSFRWFRKTHNLTWEHTFDDGLMSLYVGEITYPDNSLEFFKTIEIEYGIYNKVYEEAELACLEKLISIVELKNK